jgi:hypothetical protein
MRTFIVRASLAVFLGIGALAGCRSAAASGPKPALATGPYFIRGEITQAGQAWGTLVRGEPGTSYRVTEAFFRTSSETLIRHANGSAATAADLVVGKKISLWITGIIMESYPVQVEATEIVVE